MPDSPAPAAQADGTAGATRLDHLIGLARQLVMPGGRHILGITGAPGAGKTTLAEALEQALGSDAVLVGLDGFHLADTELHRLGRHARKGAPDTFDPAGYVHLLRRLRSGEDAVVYAPRFDRALEASIAGAVAVPVEVPLIITEGNYLLLDGPDWAPVRGLVDECWYVEVDEGLRLERLVARHVSYDRTPEEAYRRSHGSDQRNAEVIAKTRDRATRLVRLPPYRPEQIGRGTVS